MSDASAAERRPRGTEAAAPGYTFVSVSTPKPGRLDDLARIASAPSEQMEGAVEGMIAR